jgi:hypothetical protein
VAPSRVSLTSNRLFSLLPSIFTGFPAPGLTGQKAHGALYQALAQVSNGAFAATFALSSCHVLQSVGQGASVHCTER